MNPEVEVAAGRVRRALERLSRRGLGITDGDGLSEEEIAEVARAQDVLGLPAAYVAFLRSVGRGPRGFAPGMDLFVPALLSVRRTVDELLDEMSDAGLLPPHAFVFSQYSGSQFLFFVGSPGDPAVPDPVVWYYADEAPGRVTQRFNAFSSYVELLVEEFEVVG